MVHSLAGTRTATQLHGRRLGAHLWRLILRITDYRQLFERLIAVVVVGPYSNLPADFAARILGRVNVGVAIARQNVPDHVGEITVRESLALRGRRVDRNNVRSDNRPGNGCAGQLRARALGVGRVRGRAAEEHRDRAVHTLLSDVNVRLDRRATEVRPAHRPVDGRAILTDGGRESPGRGRIFWCDLLEAGQPRTQMNDVVIIGAHGRGSKSQDAKPSYE